MLSVSSSSTYTQHSSHIRKYTSWPIWDQHFYANVKSLAGVVYANHSFANVRSSKDAYGYRLALCIFVSPARCAVPSELYHFTVSMKTIDCAIWADTVNTHTHGDKWTNVSVSGYCSLPFKREKERESVLCTAQFWLTCFIYVLNCLMHLKSTIQRFFFTERV